MVVEFVREAPKQAGRALGLMDPGVDLYLRPLMPLDVIGWGRIPWLEVGGSIKERRERTGSHLDTSRPFAFQDDGSGVNLPRQPNEHLRRSLTDDMGG